MYKWYKYIQDKPISEHIMANTAVHEFDRQSQDMFQDIKAANMIAEAAEKARAAQLIQEADEVIITLNSPDLAEQKSASKFLKSIDKILADTNTLHSGELQSAGLFGSHAKKALQENTSSLKEEKSASISAKP